MPTPSPALPLPFGKYVLLERIAAGGMAEVFKAVLKGAAGFEKTLAVKRILPVFSEEAEFVSLFKDEARIASTLTHANLVQTFDFGEVDGAYYLALELVEGSDLAKLLEKLREAGQPFPTATAAFLVAEAARGLAYAHEKKGPDGQPLGIIHRDVSPQNILVSFAGEVKIADFGIAKAASKVHRTSTGMVMGKLRYMAPEQIAGDPVDARTDVFSLGVILYELLTGGTLFPEEGAAVAELIHGAQIKPPSERRPGVPPALDEIVMKALGRPVAKRYQRAADLARDLTVWVNQAAPGFTREDLGALVASMAAQTARAGTTLGVGMPTPVPPAARADVVATAAMRKAASPSAPTPVGTAAAPVAPAPPPAAGTPGPKLVAGDPLTDPHSPTAAVRQLDVPTRTSLPPTPTSRASSGDPAFVGGGAGATSTSTDASLAEREALEPPARRRGGSAFGWIAGVLIAVILGSAALVAVRFLWPAREAGGLAHADAASLAAGDADADVSDAAPLDDAGEGGDAGALAGPAPFSLTASLVDARAREALAARASDARVTRKGVPDTDYELFLSGLDARVATLELGADGRPLPAGPLPPTLKLALDARGLGDAVALVTDYLRQTGELPPAVRAALLRFLRGRPAFDARRGLRAATLAVWLDAEHRGPRLVELARQNWAAGAFCPAPAPPRRHFAPVGCEGESLVSELRAAGLEAEADALGRWLAASVGGAVAGDVTLTLLAAQWEPPSGGPRRLRVQARVLGLERPPASAFQLLGGGLDAPVAALSAPALPPPPGLADDAGAPGQSLGPPLVFVVPEHAFALVLRVTLPGGELTLRVPPP